jgi:hypothetical protein
MRFFTLAIFLISASQILGQGKMRISNVDYPVENRQCTLSFTMVEMHAVENAVEKVKSYLISTLENLNDKNLSLQLLSDVESPAGRHITFRQCYNNVPFYAATVKANLNIQGDIISILDYSIKIDGALDDDFASQEIIDQFLLTINPTAEVNWERNYFYTVENMVPAIRYEIYEAASKYYEILLNQNGDIIYEKDLLKYDKPINAKITSDSTATANVFLPDPLTTSGVTYGSPYVDNNDSDASVLTSQLINVDIIVDYSSGTFSLDGDYAIIKDIESPSIAPITRSIPDFSFTRFDNAFEDVNAYYHIYVQQMHYQNLGFTNLVNYPIQVDAHAWNGADNSSFSSYGTTPQLLFGEGGVDDAEDADVIIHEYGHATLFSASPNASSGNELKAIDEGNGDYLAASFSREISSYNWQNIFSWDGQNEFWEGRVVETTKLYPDDLVGNIYTDAPIWSSTLMQIWGDLGRDTADKLLLQSMYSFSNGMSMTDAGQLFLQTDTLLYSAAHASKIYTRMCMRGFWECDSALIDTTITKSSLFNSNSCDGKSFQILNTNCFAMGQGGTLIKWNSANDVLLQIFTSDGREVFSDYKQRITEYKLPQLSLASGIYILRVLLPENNTGYKLVKY